MPIPYRLPFDEQYPLTNDYQGHLSYSQAPGVDWALPAGTPVLAVADGRVTRCAESAAGGRYVMITHNDGRITLYSHLQAVWCMSGEFLMRGMALGLSGATGRATGPHLHFGVKHDGQWVDPMPLFGQPGAGSPTQ